MKKEDLFEAIGSASNVDLERSEGSGKGRQILRIGLIAAVVMALMVGTAAAAPTIYNAILGIETQQTSTPSVRAEDEDGDGYIDEFGISFSAQGVTLDVTMKEDAPATLSTYYLPTALAGNESWNADISTFLNTEGLSQDLPAADSVTMNLGFSRSVPLDGKYEEAASVLFTQRAAPHNNGSTPLETVQTYLAEDVEIYALTIGEVQVKCLYAPGDSNDYITAGDAWYYYWSDGYYIFSLHFSGAVDEAERAAIFESVAAVEDISPYCVDSTIPQFPPMTRHFMPTWMPEGLVLTDSNYSGEAGGGWYDYWLDGQVKNSAGNYNPGISFFESNLAERAYYGTPHYVANAVEATTVGDYEVTWFFNDDSTRVMWDNGVNAFSLICDELYTVEEIEQIILSVEECAP